MSKSQIIETLKSIVPLTRYTEDIAYDLKQIYSDRIYHYGKNADEFELYRIKQHYDKLKDFQIMPTDSIRIYVITGMECIMALCLDISEKAKNEIVECLRDELKQSDRFPSYDVDPNFISTIYVFENDKATYSSDFYPYMMGFLVHALRKKNRISYKAADSWFKE